MEVKVLTRCCRSRLELNVAERLHVSSGLQLQVLHYSSSLLGVVMFQLSSLSKVDFTASVQVAEPTLTPNVPLSLNTPLKLKIRTSETKTQQ